MAKKSRRGFPAARANRQEEAVVARQTELNRSVAVLSGSVSCYSITVDLAVAR